MDDQQLVRITNRAHSDAEHAVDTLALVGALHDHRHQIRALRAEITRLQRIIDGDVNQTALCARAILGGYDPGGPAGIDEAVGAKVQLTSRFVDWTHHFGGDADRAALNAGRQILYSWEPHGLRFAAVAAGEHDDYLTEVAAAMAQFPGDIYVRPWPEMNANWSAWQPTPGGDRPDGGTPGEFVAAWRHLADFLRGHGASNLRLVFNPDASDHSDNTSISVIWPGSDYVDVLGIDGYNWGANPATGDTWRSFDEIFAPMYGILTALHLTAPVWITEVGCKEPAAEDGAPLDPARSKARWVAEMLASTAFPRVEAVSWFNTSKERDWRLQSDPAAAAMFAGCITGRSN